MVAIGSQCLPILYWRFYIQAQILIGNIKLDRIPTKIKRKIHAQKKNTCSFYTVFQVLEVLLIKICKIQPLDLLFLVIFISFYINRYHFSQIFKTSFSIIWKKDFCQNFPFLMESLKLPTPLNNQNLLSMTRVFCRCSLTKKILCSIRKVLHTTYLFLI